MSSSNATRPNKFVNADDHGRSAAAPHLSMVAGYVRR